MIIQVDKEGKDFMLKLMDSVLKLGGGNALQLANTIVIYTKHNPELDKIKVENPTEASKEVPKDEKKVVSIKKDKE
jgi:hypothetical protein